jgi:hypothetical protein
MFRACSFAVSVVEVESGDVPDVPGADVEPGVPDAPGADVESDVPDAPGADVESDVVVAAGENCGSDEPEGGYEVVMGGPSFVTGSSLNLSGIHG